VLGLKHFDFYETEVTIAWKQLAFIKSSRLVIKLSISWELIF
jgi:hypothetical protein